MQNELAALGTCGKRGGETLLKLEEINKIFNEATPDEKIALDHINLTLEAGDFVTVIGSNGAGKSTMMNMISGALTPDIRKCID